MNTSNSFHSHLTIVLSGGSGFLGKAIVTELLDPDCPIQANEIRVFDSNDYTGPLDKRVHVIQGDIRNYDQVNSVCMGANIVIHSAAIIDWGTRPKSEVISVNYGGTQNVLKACIEKNISRLLYTSSLDAVYTGNSLVNIDESLGYPEKHQTSYCESKYLSEKLILSANNDSLKTCVIRPSDIYGEGDPYHIDSLIDMAKTGFYVRLGNGKSKCQHSYVGNMAYAHVLAASTLLQNKDSVYGEVYFITDGPGTNFFRFFDKIVQGTGYKLFPKNLWLPKWLAYFIASISELIALLLSPIKKYNPKFSRFAVSYTCNDFTFNSNLAKTDFGFVPKYSDEEALERTIHFYKK
ncbi:MAG: NAD-dependent epimerase/dehydratase family protein [Bacteroidales bacterium]|nr:NAD-dependent epimerase/dehydratase family protein [Bacteroidales bacterium]